MRVLLGSREAAEQLWNSQKTFYNTSYPSNGPSYYLLNLRTHVISLLVELTWTTFEWYLIHLPGNFADWVCLLSNLFGNWLRQAEIGFYAHIAMPPTFLCLMRGGLGFMITFELSLSPPHFHKFSLKPSLWLPVWRAQASLRALMLRGFQYSYKNQAMRFSLLVAISLGVLAISVEGLGDGISGYRQVKHPCE